MNYPKISIVTPSYNQGQFLEATILSVLNQGYQNLEYIIIDGGSTDNSVDIIKKYQDRLFYWVSEKDAGQTDAINKGMRRSNGDILGWINSDDTYVRGAFKKVVRAFHQHPECVVVHGDRILIDAAGHTIGWGIGTSFDPQLQGFNVCSETAFWKREALNAVGELKTEIRFAMDLEWFCRLYQFGKFCKLAEFLGCFRCHEQSKSSTISHIGREESEREWKSFFGNDNENWKVEAHPTKFNNILALIKHPLLLALPYFLQRFIYRRLNLS